MVLDNAWQRGSIVGENQACYVIRFHCSWHRALSSSPRVPVPHGGGMPAPPPSTAPPHGGRMLALHTSNQGRAKTRCFPRCGEYPGKGV